MSSINVICFAWTDNYHHHHDHYLTAHLLSITIMLSTLVCNIAGILKTSLCVLIDDVVQREFS